jgi:hypothetical protein
VTGEPPIDGEASAPVDPFAAVADVLVSTTGRLAGEVRGAAALFAGAAMARLEELLAAQRIAREEAERAAAAAAAATPVPTEPDEPA